MPLAKITIIPHGNYLNAIPEVHLLQQREKYLIWNLRIQCSIFRTDQGGEGLDLLLQALPPVIAKFPTLKLLIAGRVWKDDFSKYKFHKGEAPQDNIDLHIGYIPDEDVAAFYRSADLVILPYRRLPEWGLINGHELWMPCYGF